MAKLTFPIDGEKLKLEVKKRGLTLAEISREFGMGSGLLSHHVEAGATSKFVVMLLDSRYNLSYESYKADEPEEIIESVSEVKEISTFDYDQLYKCIYLAVYEAVKKAWAE